GTSVNEGANLVFSITRSGSESSGSFDVSYATANGTAAAYSDYYPASGTLTFGPWETAKSVSVATIADNVDEPAETLTMTLSAPTNGAMLDGQAGQALGTINASSSNAPPTPVSDAFTIAQCTAGSFNVIANDTDPNGDYPLTLVDVGGAPVQMGYVSVGSSTNIAWAKADSATFWDLTYTVRDSRGATATGSARVTVTGSGSVTCP
ncbi:MAG: Calx-beta domain-containing protein, partial [Allosphingosinicella sp.]